MTTSTNAGSLNTFISFVPQKRTLLLALLCSFCMILAGCGDSSTGTNGGGGGNGGGGNGGGGNGGGGSEIGTEPTFANVQQIFEASCDGAGCHIGESQNGVRLDSYNAVTTSQAESYGRLAVQPGDPDNSPLVDKIEPNPEIPPRMPQTGNFLSEDRINQIRTWIQEGAENN